MPTCEDSSHDVHIDGLEEVNDEACYRAMDWLLEIEPALAKEAYFQVTDLLNLEVDLLFFDTTSTYFETEDADDPLARDENGHALPQDADPELIASRKGFRAYGKSKDSRDDLPQVVVGMALTRDGIPVRVWSWPGGTADSDLGRVSGRDQGAVRVSSLIQIIEARRWRPAR
ncbi:transposase, partial [Streptomyces sp. NPDC048362]